MKRPPTAAKRLRICSIDARRARHLDWFREDLERLFEMLATHAIWPRVAERNAFDEIANATSPAQEVGLGGKLVLCTDLPPRDGRHPRTPLGLMSALRLAALPR